MTDRLHQVFRGSAVLAALARHGIETNREALAALSDLLGVGHRPPTPAGRLGNRRWTEQDVNVLVAAFRLRRDHGLTDSTLVDLIRGRIDPSTLVERLTSNLETLASHAA